MFILVVGPQERHKGFYDSILTWYKNQNTGVASLYAPVFSFCQTVHNAKDVLLLHDVDLLIADDLDEESESDSISLYQYLRYDEQLAQLRPALKQTYFVFVTGRRSVWIFYRDKAHPHDPRAALFGSREGIPFQLNPDIDYPTFKQQLPR